MPGALRILPACFLLLSLASSFGGRGLEAADPGTISGLAQGVADWVRGDDLRFYPPLIITREQIDAAIDIIDEVLGELTREAGLG